MEKVSAEVDILAEMSRSQKCQLNTRVRIGADLRAERLILEQCADGGPERCRIARIPQQHSTDFVFNLIADPADLAGDHRARLPHRFGHGETEALSKTFCTTI